MTQLDLFEAEEPYSDYELGVLKGLALGESAIAELAALIERMPELGLPEGYDMLSEAVEHAGFVLAVERDQILYNEVSDGTMFATPPRAR